MSELRHFTESLQREEVTGLASQEPDARRRDRLGRSKGCRDRRQPFALPT
jgi:hypothetical protein